MGTMDTCSGRLDTRQGREAGHEVPPRRPESLHRQAELAHVDPGHDDALAAEARIEGEEVLQAAREEERADEEHERERDLADHERAPQADALAAGGLAAAADLEDAVGADARRLQGRHEAEEHARGDRERGGEAQHAPVNAEIEDDALVGGLDEGHQRRAERAGQDRAAGRASPGEQETLGEQLPDDAARATRRGRAARPSRAGARSPGRAAGWRGSRRRSRRTSAAVPSSSQSGAS